MFEFTVPDGDYDYDGEEYHFKTLVFTEKSKKAAITAIKEFVDAGTPFSMAFVEKEGN